MTEISFVVPALDEAENLALNLPRLRALPGDAEILVVDGGSCDGSVAVAERLATVIHSEPGRGQQLRAGGQAARGAVLVFLHADAWIDVEALESALSALERGARAGCFRQRIEARAPIYRCIERAAALRARLGVIYGDSGLFVSREVYREVGGYPPVPLFEDVLISRALRRLARPVVAERGRIHLSARRWKHRGPVRTTLLNWGLTAAFWAGVSPNRLARWYYPSTFDDEARRSEVISSASRETSSR
ncbi:MAG: TIGR04283 family arsenosugar biosynthesis glycosyltransferase [Planctomycetota bacterium]